MIGHLFDPDPYQNPPARSDHPQPRPLPDHYRRIGRRGVRQARQALRGQH